MPPPQPHPGVEPGRKSWSAATRLSRGDAGARDAAAACASVTGGGAGGVGEAMLIEGAHSDAMDGGSYPGDGGIEGQDVLFDGLDDDDDDFW